MKNLINKVRHHGKKITIYLKSQPKWVVRCMFGIGAILGLVLSLHTHPIGGTNAQSIECPEGQYLATGGVCITNEKDIVIQATATEDNQTLKINKYFANDYTVDRGDGTTGDLIADTTHTYATVGTYNVILSLSGTASRWTFQNNGGQPLVSKYGTTMSGVKITFMPSLADGFGDSATEPGNNFFSWFNSDGALTGLPEGSFILSTGLTTVGNDFFSFFNGGLGTGGSLISLPDGSFDISNITTVGNHFFSYFNSKGALTSLPTGSFDTSNITSVGNYFLNFFNTAGALISLPDGSFRLSTGLTTVGNSFFGSFNAFGKITRLPDDSFNTSNITSVGNFFFDEFNSFGALTSLPEGSFDISNITTASDRFFSYFNSIGKLTSLPEGSFDINNITTVGSDFFSYFNYNGAITSLTTGSFNTSSISGAVGNDFFRHFNYSGALQTLPEGSFDISNITTVGSGFFSYFNYNGAITSLTTGSFNTSNITTVGNDFFHAFNMGGMLTSLPDDSFDTSNIATGGNGFFSNFNENGALTNLPEGSFKTDKITKVGDYFFSHFNSNGAITNLPEGSFKTDKIAKVGDYFFGYFNLSGALTNLPEGSFDTSNITSAGSEFFYCFNYSGQLINLPDSFTLNSTGAQSTGGYVNAFYSLNYILNKNVSDLVTGVMSPGIDKNTFSDNQPGRCGVDPTWLVSTADACHIRYDANGGVGSVTGGYAANTTGVVAGSNIALPTRTGYVLSGWYTNPDGGELVENITFPGMDGQTLYARWVDNISPTCDIAYSTTGATTGSVVASLTGCSEAITGTDLQHTFTGNGTYTFTFQDLAGNTGSTGATVTWINNPTCSVAYSTTGYTNKPVSAYLTGCNKSITGTDLQYTFTGNGEHTFEFQDLFGNTGSSKATVTWITDNTTYINVEGDEFRWNNLTICNPDNSGECITMMDRNLGATTNDTTKTGSYGYKYQWGNNYGFKDGCWVSTGCSDDITSSSLTGSANWPKWDDTYDISGYYGKIFLRGSLNYWSDYTDHKNLWGGLNDNSSNGWGYPVKNANNRQGPCPSGYHVPNVGERRNVVKRWVLQVNTGLLENPATVSPDFINDYSGAIAFRRAFNIPGAGTRDWNYGTLSFGGHILWTSTASYSYEFGSYSARESALPPSTGMPIRCFKDNSGYNSGISFSIDIDDTINVGEYTDFTVKVIKDGTIFRNYTGTLYFELTDRYGNLVDTDLYSVPYIGFYDFTLYDRGNKTFKNGLRVKKAGTYKLQIIDLFDKDISKSEIIVVKTGHSSADVKYDTSKFNLSYSNEMNKAYQYAYNYRVTTQSTIKQANMTGGLNRIAMAKMLTNYATYVLGEKNYDTGRNCSFKDVSTSLDKQYDNGVTKACRLGIMGINMPNNNFNPYGTVTRAEFATALSRLLFGTEDGVNKYYSTHITKLYREGIITKTDPTLKELRGYVMLMLMRVGK